MFGSLKSTVATIYVLTMLGTTIAMPAPVRAPAPLDYVSIIVPGRGLPSPASLNLTNADLLKPADEPSLQFMAARDAKEHLEKRFNPQCFGEPRCRFVDALACYNYLLQLGPTRCEASGYTTHCTANGCSWNGRAENKGYTSTNCDLVARGGSWVLNSCRVSGDRLSGANAAWNNGNHIVEIYGS